MKRRIIIGLIAAVTALVLASIASAVTVRGTVYNGSNGTPVAGATVKYLNRTTGGVGVTTTNAYGNFSFGGLVPGQGGALSAFRCISTLYYSGGTSNFTVPSNDFGANITIRNQGWHC